MRGCGGRGEGVRRDVLLPKGLGSPMCFWHLMLRPGVDFVAKGEVWIRQTSRGWMEMRAHMHVRYPADTMKGTSELIPVRSDQGCPWCGSIVITHMPSYPRTAFVNLRRALTASPHSPRSPLLTAPEAPSWPSRAASALIAMRAAPSNAQRSPVVSLLEVVAYLPCVGCAGVLCDDVWKCVQLRAR